ncbi:MAG: hypothetical protein ACE5KM_17120 [Planctomycetaceae bacterium]
MISKIESDVFVDGNLRARTFTLPAGTVGDAEVKAAAGIAATKLRHQHALVYRQAGGLDVVAANVPLYTVRGVAATVVDVEVVGLVAPAGGDKAFTIDLQKCNQAAPAPVSLLQSVISYDATRGDCETVQGTITTAALADGDTLVANVAVSGLTGSQGQGLVVTVTLREDAE